MYKKFESETCSVHDINKLLFVDKRKDSDEFFGKKFKDEVTSFSLLQDINIKEKNSNILSFNENN